MMMMMLCGCSRRQRMDERFHTKPHPGGNGLCACLFFFVLACRSVPASSSSSGVKAKPASSPLAVAQNKQTAMEKQRAASHQPVALPKWSLGLETQVFCSAVFAVCIFTHLYLQVVGLLAQGFLWDEPSTASIAKVRAQ